MSAPKPRHLQADYAAQFADESVLAAYAALNAFSRERMDPKRVAAFDAAVEALVRSHVPGEMFSCRVRSTLIWGRPSPARARSLCAAMGAVGWVNATCLPEGSLNRKC